MTCGHTILLCLAWYFPMTKLITFYYSLITFGQYFCNNPYCKVLCMLISVVKMWASETKLVFIHVYFAKVQYTKVRHSIMLIQQKILFYRKRYTLSHHQNYLYNIPYLWKLVCPWKIQRGCSVLSHVPYCFVVNKSEL